MIYHISHNDLDGVGCHVVGRWAVGIQNGIYKRINCDNQEVDRVIAETLAKARKEDRIFITDVSPTDDNLIQKIEERGNVTLIDHHKTALERIGNRDWAHIDMEMCATLKFYYYLRSLSAFNDRATEYKLLIFSELVNDHDMWIKDDPRSERLSILLDAIGIDEFYDRFSDNIFVQEEHHEKAIINAFLRKRNERMEKALNTITLRTDSNGNRYLQAFYDDYDGISHFASYLLRDHPTVRYVKVINISHGSVSLRSRGDFDVSVIAKANGGGGHRAASGYPIKRKIMEEMNQIFDWE